MTVCCEAVADPRAHSPHAPASSNPHTLVRVTPDGKRALDSYVKISKLVAILSHVHIGMHNRDTLAVRA